MVAKRRQNEDFQAGNPMCAKINKITMLLSVTVQLNKVEVHELKPNMLTKDKGGLVWR